MWKQKIQLYGLLIGESGEPTLFEEFPQLRRHLALIAFDIGEEVSDDGVDIGLADQSLGNQGVDQIANKKLGE